jgi:glutaredoxin
MWRRLWEWLRGRSQPKLAHLMVTLYTRRGCHLCDAAREQLVREQRRHAFRFEIVDVDSSPDLALRYGELVPVVEVDGKLRFRGGVNGVLLRRLLRAECRRAGESRD